MTTPSPVHEARIVRIVERAPQTRSFFLHIARQIRLRPGQFLSCLLPVGAETLTRPYSVASDPDDPLLEICLNLVPGGAGSQHLFSLETGATLRFTGPWGTFIMDDPPDAECVFIAEGMGIAPIRPMLRRALARGSGHHLRLHYGASNAAHLLYAEEFTALAQEHPQFTFVPALDAPLLAVIDQRYVEQDTDRRRHFYICGVGDVVLRLRDLLRQAGYERRAVAYEKW